MAVNLAPYQNENYFRNLLIPSKVRHIIAIIKIIFQFFLTHANSLRLNFQEIVQTFPLL